MKKSEEKEILKALESGEIELERPSKALLANLAKAGENTFKKDKRINIRISNRDLIAVQSRASEEGIPYQTLVSSIIHKYVSGSLRDIAANKKRQGDA